MEYRKATGEEAQLVCDIVKETKAKIIGDGEVMVYEIMRKAK